MEAKATTVQTLRSDWVIADTLCYFNPSPNPIVMGFLWFIYCRLHQHCAILWAGNQLHKAVSGTLFSVAAQLLQVLEIQVGSRSCKAIDSCLWELPWHSFPSSRTGRARDDFWVYSKGWNERQLCGVSQQYLLCNAFLHLMLQGSIVPKFSHLQRDNYQVLESWVTMCNS